MFYLSEKELDKNVHLVLGFPRDTRTDITKGVFIQSPAYDRSA